jgi:hypothetical protein
MTPLDMVFALGLAILAATNLWALRAANEAAAERKAMREEAAAQRDALAAFRLEAAKSYVAKEHLAVLDERLVRTEERVLAELREFRTTFTAAFTNMGNGRRSQQNSSGGS